MDLKSTRRTFIKAAGASLAAAAAAVPLVASAEQSTNPNDAAASIADIVWDEEYDIVIAGAGCAGMAAAITVATEGNGESCLLLEKAEEPWGCTPVSGGRCIWTDDADLFLTYMKGLYAGEPTTPEDVLRAYAEGATENLNWILSLDPIVEEMTIEEPGAQSTSQPNCYPEYPELEGSLAVGNLRVGKRVDGGQVTGPKHISQFLFQKVTEDFEDEIDFAPSTPLIALVQDPDTQEIVGAIASENGQNIYIKANLGVIMCVGGFEHNPEMMMNYLAAPNARGAGRDGNTGDGIKICERLNCDFWHMGSVAGFWPGARTLAGGSASFNMQYGIIVGTNGRRFFMDHGGGVSGVAATTDADLRLTVNVRHGHMNFGGEWPHMIMPSKCWFVCDANGLEAGAFGSSTDPVADGLALSADTLEELAALMDVPAGELVKTAETWNGYCETGEDLSFYRPKSYMYDAELATPPFYAGMCGPSFLNTDGGPVRNARGQILNVDGEPIPHLYSAGEFGSIWCNMYQGACNIGEGLIFGRIAVRDILGLPGKVYVNPYVSQRIVGTPVDGIEAFESQLGISMTLPEGATNLACSIFEDEGVAEVTFSYDANSFTQRAKTTETFEDVSDRAVDMAEDFEFEGQQYTLNYTKPASAYVATSIIWFDEAAGVSRAVVANTSQDRISLTAVAEIAMAGSR